MSQAGRDIRRVGARTRFAEEKVSSDPKPPLIFLQKQRIFCVLMAREERERERAFSALASRKSIRVAGLPTGFRKSHPLYYFILEKRGGGV